MAIGPWHLPRITGTVQFVIAFLIIITLILRPEGIFDRWEIDDLVRRLGPLARRAFRSEVEPTRAEVQADADKTPEVEAPVLATGPPVLRGDGVAKHFEGVIALGGVDIEVLPGEILGLIGPNGSGKTTLLNVVSGVYVPTEGSIAFEGKEISGRKPHQVAEAGLSRTFQNIRLFAQLTVRENVEAALPPGADESRVDEVLAWFALEAAEREKASTSPTGCNGDSRSHARWYAVRP